MWGRASLRIWWQNSSASMYAGCAAPSCSSNRSHAALSEPGAFAA